MRLEVNLCEPDFNPNQLVGQFGEEPGTKDRSLREIGGNGTADLRRVGDPEAQGRPPDRHRLHRLNYLYCPGLKSVSMSGGSASGPSGKALAGRAASAPANNAAKQRRKLPPVLLGLNATPCLGFVEMCLGSLGV
jgi:hypothetical protein